MGRFVHKTTLEVRHTGNTPDFSPVDWLVSTDTVEDPVTGLLATLYNWVTKAAIVAKKYWKYDGGQDAVIEMNQTEKDAVDAADLAAAKVARRVYLKTRGWEYMAERYDPAEHRLLLSLYINAKTNGMPNRATHVAQVWAWMESLVGHVQSRRDDVDAAATVAEVEAISLNETGYTNNDPNVTVGNTMAITD